MRVHSYTKRYTLPLNPNQYAVTTNASLARSIVRVQGDTTADHLQGVGCMSNCQVQSLGVEASGLGWRGGESAQL